MYNLATWSNVASSGWDTCTSQVPPKNFVRFCTITNGITQVYVNLYQQQNT